MSVSSDSSPLRTAIRLSLTVLALVALMPPLLWLVAGGVLEHGRARASASAVAWMLDHPASRADARPDQAGLMQALGLTNQQAAVTWGPAHTDHAIGPGKVPAGPTLTARAPWTSHGTGAAEVRVHWSLRPLLLQALWLSMASTALALALWAFFMHRAVTRMARAETKLRTAASLDPLTGLLNRNGLRRRLVRALARQRDGGAAVGILLVDLDRFGMINETLGQAAGDELLRSVANRIRAVTRDSDGLARFGGDQFAVHVDTATGVQALTAMARNLKRAFEAPHLLEGREVVATFSIGVAIADADDGSVDSLMHQAALAVRAAKRQGGNRFSVHEVGCDADDTARRMDLEQRLHGALGDGQFFVVYQPIVDARTESLVTVEALLRWQDPQRGTISPVEFIPSLEQTGLIVPVGRWVLREACLQAARWPQSAPDAPPIHVSVNLSPMQFAEPDFLQMVAGVLRETGLAPARLQLEVTEGLLLEPSAQTLRKIDGLAALGVRLAVDDFGMGYSSLMYLKRFRLHGLKIDRMFVRDIVERPQDLTIVRAIIDLGHGLGMHVTAEGVETQAQGDALRALGCDTLQGFLYGRPSKAGHWQVAAGASSPVPPVAVHPAAMPEVQPA